MDRSRAVAGVARTSIIPVMASPANPLIAGSVFWYFAVAPYSARLCRVVPDVSLASNSSPGFPGEGDRAKRGGGVLGSLEENPSTSLRLVPLPGKCRGGFKKNVSF